MTGEEVRKLMDTVGIHVRKKPIVVRAFQYSGEEPFEIETREGKMKAKKGDWIIEGIEKELYPCALQIFIKTYEMCDG